MKCAKFTTAIMERLRSNGWTLSAMIEKVGSNPARSFFFRSLIFFRKEQLMKTVIGFVCGVIGFVLAVATFVAGIVAGIAIGASNKVTVTKNGSDGTVYHIHEEED